MNTTRKTLRRKPDQGQITGICAGIAEYFDLDVTLIRVIFVILIFATGGLIIIVYIILAIILPVHEIDTALKNASEQTAGTPSATQKVHTISQEIHANYKTDNVRNYLGIGLLILGIWLLLGQFFPDFLELRWDYIWPVLLILAGLFIVTRKGK
jgi:phage shock protein C